MKTIKKFIILVLFSIIILFSGKCFAAAGNGFSKFDSAPRYKFNIDFFILPSFRSSTNNIRCNNCNNFIFVNEYHIITCIEICDDNHFIYKRNEDEKYCLASCEYNNSVLYQDGTNNICYIIHIHIT